MMLSSAKPYWRLNVVVYVIYVYQKKNWSYRTEPCGTPDITHVLSDRDPLTETLCLRCERNDFIQFWCFQLFHRRLILLRDVYEGLWRNQAGWHLSVSCYL